MSSNPLPTSSTADYEDMYSKIGGTYETAFAQDEGLLAFLESTLKIIPPQARILDLGCGTGRPIASTLASAGHQIFGVDFSQTMVSLSKQAVPSGLFAVGDMRTFDPFAEWTSHPEFQSQSGSTGSTGFDAVFNILSLFILSRSEIEEMGKKWKSWIRKGGLLCICTIAAEDLQPRKEGGEGYDEDGYCVRDIKGRFMGNEVSFSLMTREGWRWLFKENGFEIVEETNHIYRPPAEADSLVEPHLFLVARKM